MASILSCRGLRAALPHPGKLSALGNAPLIPHRGVTDITYYKEVDSSHLHLREAQSSFRKFQLKLRRISAMEERRTRRNLADKRVRLGARGAGERITRVAGVASEPLEDESPFFEEQIAVEADPVRPGTYVERTPTTMLKILGENVARNVNNPDYRMHDDPFLLPYSSNAKKKYVLAKESGRKAARFVLESHPEFFEKNLIEAVPKIKSFLPRPGLVGDKSTLEDLDVFINAHRVEEASEVYKILEKKGEEVSDERKQQLLELLAFNNGQAAREDDFNITAGARMPVQDRNANVWGGEEGGSLADKIYANMENKTPEARKALFLGMMKHRAPRLAEQLLKEMKEKGDKIDREVYTEAIFLAAGKNWSEVEAVVKQMKAAGISPDCQTYVNLINGAWRCFGWKGDLAKCEKLVAGLLSEMKAGGMQISVGVYAAALRALVNKDTKRDSKFVHHLVDELQGRGDLLETVETEQDSFFFSDLMRAAQKANDLQLGYKIQEVVLAGKNEAFLNNLAASNSYYAAFFALVEANESLDVVMDFISWFAPNRHNLSTTFFKQLLDRVLSDEEVRYIPRVWAAFELCDFQNFHNDRCEVYEKLLVAATTHRAPIDPTLDLRPAYLRIVRDIYEEFLDLSENPRWNRAGNPFDEIPLAHVVLDLALNLALQEEDTDLARDILTLCTKLNDKLRGAIKGSTLIEFVAKCKANPTCRQAMVDAVTYGAAQAVTGIDELAAKVMKEVELTKDEEVLIDKLLTKLIGSEWSQVAQKN